MIYYSTTVLSLCCKWTDLFNGGSLWFSLDEMTKWGGLDEVDHITDLFPRVIL